MDDEFLLDLDEFDNILYNDETVIRSHKVAESLKKKGFNVKKPLWGNLKAS